MHLLKKVRIIMFNIEIVKDILLMKHRTKKLLRGCHSHMCCLRIIYANVLFYTRCFIDIINYYKFITKFIV